MLDQNGIDAFALYAGHCILLHNSISFCAIAYFKTDAFYSYIWFLFHISAHKKTN